MAASGHPLHRTLSGSVDRLQGNPTWPNGACGYRDLNAGARAPRCGCRRFWLNVTGSVVSHEGERAWCFCGHHACFHDIHNQPVDDLQTRVSNDSPAALTRSRRQSDFASRALADPIFNSTEASPSGKTGTGLGIRNASQSRSQSINTRLWQALNGFARGQESDDRDGSKLASTAVQSVTDEPRPSPTRIMQDHMQQHRSMGPPVSIPFGQPLETRAEEYSATEVATPSIAGTPDFRALGLAGVPVASPRRTSPAQGMTAIASQASAGPLTTPKSANLLVKQAAPGPPSLSLQEIRNTIQDYGRRLNVLENISFSQFPHDEFHEKLDMYDGRLLDLEHWRADQDSKAEQDMTPSPVVARSLPARHRPMLHETNSQASDGSFDSTAAAQTEAIVLATLAANAETGPRIDALEARIEDLERAELPSFARPWHIQVVLLPFGRHLPGIWFSSAESTQHSIRSTQLSEEWSGAPPAVTSSFMSSDGAWTTDSIQAWANETQDEWLSPKACGPTGTVFQRLSSRGFVRNVTFTAPDAYHILRTLSSAFARVADSDSHSTSSNSDKFRGLLEPLIPLRKIRKSTRLRFLTPSEMVTSATWTASFLESSVFMRVGDGQRRLYITTPEAYLQKSGVNWTWPMIKALPIYDASGDEQVACARGGLVEACWTHNPRLDRVASLHSSFATHEDSSWDVHSQHSNPPVSNSIAMAEDANGERLSMPTTRPQKRIHTRSASLPSSTSADALVHDGAAFAPRRVSSFANVSSTQQQALQTQAQLLQHTLQQQSHAQSAAPMESTVHVAKRRRISTSPELERRGGVIFSTGVNFTPATSNRFSREPPSPGITSSGGGGFGRVGSAGASTHHAHHTAGTMGAQQTYSQATSNSNPTINTNTSSCWPPPGSAPGRHGRVRGTTPFAYATPHSNLESAAGGFCGGERDDDDDDEDSDDEDDEAGSGGVVGDCNYGGEDGDTEVNTAPSEREWEGVQEGTAEGDDMVFAHANRTGLRAERLQYGVPTAAAPFDQDDEDGEDVEDDEAEEEEDDDGDGIRDAN